jgi:cysteine-rich secretory family protein
MFDFASGIFRRPRLRPVPRLAVVAAVTVVVCACQRASLTGPSAGGSTVAPDDLSFCADEVNRYRASIGESPLSRSGDLEAFAAQAAQNDGLAHQAHHFFAMTAGAGMSAAENEILWWRGFAVRNVIQQGLKQMWQAGPAGEHYDIMVGAYSQIGCGVFINGAEVTVAQDFR